jgi:hypothetical protein
MPKKSEKLTDFEMECMERDARRRAAWGAFGAQMREINLRNECKELRLKGKSEEDIKRFIQSKSHGYLYIG